jgi:hypothetical protein
MEPQILEKETFIQFKLKLLKLENNKLQSEL